MNELIDGSVTHVHLKRPLICSVAFIYNLSEIFYLHSIPEEETCSRLKCRIIYLFCVYIFVPVFNALYSSNPPGIYLPQILIQVS